jgi:hypothetical protein
MRQAAGTAEMTQRLRITLFGRFIAAVEGEPPRLIRISAPRQRVCCEAATFHQYSRGRSSMVRLTTFACGVLLALAFAVADAGAQGKQGKKKSAQCVPNFFAACMKRCTSGGGRSVTCPDFCNRRKAELGC